MCLSKVCGLTLALVFSSIQVAAAADLPAAPIYPKAPAYVSAPSWTGFYIGANAGGHWSSDQNADIFTAPGFNPINPATINNTLPTSLSSSGFEGGVHAGYNWQMSSLVLGVEADYDWLSRSKSITTPVGAPASLGCIVGSPSSPCWITTDSAQDRWLSTVRGRVGFALDRALIYGTGGVAIAGWSINHQFTDLGFGYVYSPASIGTRTGWTIGGGLEYALTRNWLVRAEYLYANFGTVDNTVASAAGRFGPTTLVYQDKLQENVVRGGVSYKFGQ
jgi:outer membrane immunogenic protein